MTDKEALKLALEVLEVEQAIYRGDREDGTPEYILEAITAIKEALAQPEQEPVACKTLCELCVKRGYTFCANAVKVTPITAPPQPEQDIVQRLSALVRAQQITIDKLEAKLKEKNT